MQSLTKDNPVLSGIYQIEFSETDKVYVGSSIDINYRWKKHLYLLSKGCHVNPNLQHLFNLYGPQSLSLSILEDMTGASEQDIRNREQFYLENMDWSKSLNICKDSRGGAVTEEANQKRKETLREYFRKNPEALIGENNPFYGKRHSQESKDKISRANSGKERSEEFKEQKSKFMSERKGKHHSEEHKRSLRERFTGVGNPSAIPVTVQGVQYPSKRAALRALGLKYNYQLDRFLNA